MDSGNSNQDKEERKNRLGESLADSCFYFLRLRYLCNIYMEWTLSVNWIHCSKFRREVWTGNVDIGVIYIQEEAWKVK